jgi:hypothetical protein
MALNTRGEFENAPGASRREKASIQRELANSQKEAAEAAEHAGYKLYSATRKFEARRDVARKVSRTLPEETLSKPSSYWSNQAEEMSRKCRKSFDEAASLKKEARSNKWRAFGNSIVAVVQTSTAKLGL